MDGEKASLGEWSKQLTIEHRRRHNTDSEIILCLSDLVSGSSANVDQSKADLGIGDLGFPSGYRYSTTT